MSSILIKNIGAIVTGDLKNPLRNANSIFIDGGIIREIGNNISRKADRVIDADGITAMPGLIDSHSHPSIGEYTPAQNALSWITNYMHGGVTALISAGELHLPGLPLPPDAHRSVSGDRYEALLRQPAAVRGQSPCRHIAFGSRTRGERLRRNRCTWH